MPKYNLMDSQQPEFFDENLEVNEPKSDKSEPETKEDKTKEVKPKPATPESDFSEKLFSETEIPRRPDSQPEPSATKVSPSPDASTNVKPAQVQDTAPKVTTVPKSPEVISRETSKSETAASRTSRIDLSTYDMTLPTSNYKPLIIGLSIFAAVVVIVILIWKLFLSAKHEIAPPVETAEQKLKREILLRKDNYLNTVNATTYAQLGYLAQLINLKPAKVRYSSFYVYGQNLACEVFTTNRTDLAEFNVKLKNSPSFANFNLETVDKRPGTRGGLFALYDIKTAGGISPLSASADSTRISRTPQDWITETTQKNNLTVEMQKQISSRQEELFTVMRYEYKLKGSDVNCQSLITALASAKTNIGIHKLTLLPTNQRDLAKSPYQLHLILDFYM
jgi:hypothetical protein